MRKEKRYLDLQKEFNEIMSLLSNKSKKETLEKLPNKKASNDCSRNKAKAKGECECKRCVEEKEYLDSINDLEDNILELKEKIHRLEVQNKELKEHQSLLNNEEIKNIYHKIEMLNLDNNFAICKRLKEVLTKILQNFVSSKNDIYVEKMALENVLKQKNREIEELNAKLEEIKTLEEIISNQKIKEKILINEILDLKGSIRVFCRIRPPLNSASLCKIKNSFEEIEISVPQKNHSFQFDRIFSSHDGQIDVFNEIAPLISNGLEGYKVCIFAYGQTGSGKTFTMEGSPENKGVILNSLDLIFDSLERMQTSNWNFIINVNIIEIYNENIYDLLKESDEKIEIKYLEDKLTLTNCSEYSIENKNEIFDLISVAHRNRSVGQTAANEKSSRSHLVFILKIEMINEQLKEKRSAAYSFIDLAGSERISHSKVEGIRLKETQNINKSLSSLGNVISSLIRKDPHIPFRDSKLTYLLKDYLTGNSRILMFVNISPEFNHFNETVCSLRFASKVSDCKLDCAKKNIFKEI
ncbi:hypothetical protein H312_00990 [Anncaliia algerae PRA339]|uniref:Kinesin motor domain-containing protein n=1 Tax=Anncaliia algerae PRA339 TaxID=1288291 RepID=A0A059F386_9MICR|nr:hypothetical protein H312_00990 [Anncaliia algerae PRA339]